VEFWVGMNKRHTYITYVAKSKTGSKEMHGIHFDQDVQVCGIFYNPNISGTPLIMTFSLLNAALEGWAISLFLSILWNLHVFHFFLLFLLLL
jgi:hypothetical protein